MISFPSPHSRLYGESVGVQVVCLGKPCLSQYNSCWGQKMAGQNYRTAPSSRVAVVARQLLQRDCNISGRTRLTQLRRCSIVLDSTMYLYKVLSIQNILNTRRLLRQKNSFLETRLQCQSLEARLQESTSYL
jgi:hypothetical protein